MVKVKAVKPARTAEAKAPKVVIQPLPPLACSPSTRSNAATIKDNINILNPTEQKSFKQWIPEIKQIQGLIIRKCGLYVQAKSSTPQLIQKS